MNIDKINNINFNGMYKLPNSQQNLKELTDFVLPTYYNISKEPILLFSGNNPFKIGLAKLMQMLAEKNNGSIDWLKMNAENHGIKISDDSNVLNIITTDRDINSLKDYMLKRIESRKPTFKDKVLNFFGIRNIPQYDKDLPPHLIILSEGLKLDGEETKAYEEFSKRVKEVSSPKELFKALMSEH